MNSFPFINCSFKLFGIGDGVEFFGVSSIKATDTKPSNVMHPLMKYTVSSSILNVIRNEHRRDVKPKENIPMPNNSAPLL